MPYAQTARARIRQAAPTLAMRSSALVLLVGELRGALRDERVLLAHEDVALLAHGDDDLAPVAERVGHRARIADRHGRAAVAVAHPEVDGAAVLPDRAVHDLAGQLVRAPALGARGESARLHRLAGCVEARVDERSGQHDGRGERDDQADPALAGRVHQRLRSIPDASPIGPVPAPRLKSPEGPSDTNRETFEVVERLCRQTDHARQT